MYSVEPSVVVSSVIIFVSTISNMMTSVMRPIDFVFKLALSWSLT